MGRKSKKAGSGHLPLTNYERQIYSKPYGTTSARLSGISQYSFGNCALSLHPAKDSPVASPYGGYIYEKPAILEYLLTKTQELKNQQIQYDEKIANLEIEQSQHEQETKRKAVEVFENAQKVVPKKQKKEEINPLSKTSYWLSEFQPKLPKAKPSASSSKKNSVVDSNTTALALVKEEEEAPAAVSDLPPPPPKRPSSPNSQQPLRRKDLIPLSLKFNTKDQVVCAISEKPIVSQQALALITTKKTNTSDDDESPTGGAQVVLEQVFNDIHASSTDPKEKLICPITGKKIYKILKLQKGGSSFSGTGATVEAKTYKPTMT